MITANNNNKYYEMQETEDNIEVKYGRVDSSTTTITKPRSQWQSLYNSKIKKGYKDVTDLVSFVKEEKVKILSYSKELYDIFLKKMMDYRDGLVSSTYSVKAINVTRRQLDEAQIHINALSKVTAKDDIEEVNNLLLKLYTVIPRYMDKVQSYLLPNISLNKLVQTEQDKLDALSSQVIEEKNDEDNITENNITEENNDFSISNHLGISNISVIKDTPKDIDYIIKQITKPIKGLFEVEIQKHLSKFNNYVKDNSQKENCRFLIHGTRCSSVIPIIEQGLKIRPTGNYHYSGKAYGEGTYFSEVTKKSLGYTGNYSDKVLLIYKVFTGNPFVYKGWYRGNDFELTYDELKKRGYNSTFVEAGNGLLNSEIIVYKEEQSHLKYIIWL